MSELRTLLLDMAERLFAGNANASEEDSFASILDAQFHLLLVPESQGGFGGSWSDAFALFRLAAFHGVAPPIGEAIVAHHLLARHGITAPEGWIALADTITGQWTDGRFSDRLGGVGHGRSVDWIVAEADGALLLLRADAGQAATGSDAADDLRATMLFQDANAQRVPIVGTSPRALGAFLRTSQAAGAIEAALALSIDYVGTRQQFGKPLGKQQAVQQALAEAATHAAAVRVAALATSSALDTGDAEWEVAAAKLRANLAIDVITPILHQVHGAMGFTQEYALQRFTRRLLAWRSDFGNDRYWSERLADQVLGVGADGFWNALVQRSDKQDRSSSLELSRQP